MADQPEQFGEWKPERAFVVKFRTGPANVEEQAMGGRVEHITSGKVSPFASMEDLWSFLMLVLNTL
jgi:hypothetical protein